MDEGRQADPSPGPEIVTNRTFEDMLHGSWAGRGTGMGEPIA
jgi:hypothetical protein